MIGHIPYPIVITFWIILGILSVVSFLGNVFITAVIGHQWLQMGKINPCDFLLIILSISRFLLQLISIMGYPAYFNVPQSDLFSSSLTIMSVTWYFSYTINLWCATWLSIFYCVKVTSFPSHLFFWLKTRINELLPRLFAMSVTASMIMSVPSFICSFQNKLCNLTETHSANNYQGMYHAPFFQQLSIIAINFILNVTASILLFTSLWRHTRNLRESGVAVKDLSTQVHISVMKSVLLYLFLYVLYTAGMMLATTGILEYGRPERLVTEIFLSALSSGHSLILILTHPKLKKASTEILKIREWTLREKQVCVSCYLLKC